MSLFPGPEVQTSDLVFSGIFSKMEMSTVQRTDILLIRRVCLEIIGQVIILRHYGVSILSFTIKVLLF